MFTETSNARLSEIHPELARRIRQLDAMVPSLNLQVTQGLRSWSDQDELYAQGRTVPGKIVTNCPAGYSWHSYGLAVDLVPEEIMPGQPDWNTSHPAWKKLLAAAPSCGLAEGATFRTFPDFPHFYPQELSANPDDGIRQDFRDAGMVGLWQQIRLGAPQVT